MIVSLQVSNIANVSEVTVVLAGNAVSNRYGTLIGSNSSTTFLYGECRSLIKFLHSFVDAFLSSCKLGRSMIMRRIE